MTRRTLAALTPIIIALAFTPSAMAWHATVSLDCVYGPSPHVTATYSYAFPNGGPWTAQQQILKVDQRIDQWTVIASQTARGLNSDLTPNTLTVPMPAQGGDFVAKTWWDNGDAGFAKSPVRSCAPPVVTCAGDTVPQGSPMPVCWTDCQGAHVAPAGTVPVMAVCAPPPPVTPPTPPPAQVTPPPPPAAPVCPPYKASRYHIRKTGRTYTLTGPNATKIVWKLDGKVVGKGRHVKVSRLRGRHVLTVRAVVNGRAPVRDEHVFPRRTAPPRGVG